MQNFSDNFNETKIYEIIEVSFKRLKKVDYDADFIIKDDIKITNTKKSEFTIEYKREVYSEPKSNFTLNIVFIIKQELKNDFINIIDLTKHNSEYLMEQIMTEPDAYISVVAAVASLLTSEITNSVGPYPIVTPPYFIGEKEKEE